MKSYQLAAGTIAKKWGDLTFLLEQKGVKSCIVPWLTFTTYAGVPGFGTSAVTWPLLRDRTVYIADIQSAGVWICTKPSHPRSFCVQGNELPYSAICFNTSFYFLNFFFDLYPIHIGQDPIDSKVEFTFRHSQCWTKHPSNTTVPIPNGRRQRWLMEVPPQNKRVPSTGGWPWETLSMQHDVMLE